MKYVSGLLGYGKRLPLPIDYRILQTVQIHFDSRQTIKGYQIEEVATTPASSTSTAQ